MLRLFDLESKVVVSRVKLSKSMWPARDAMWRMRNSLWSGRRLPGAPDQNVLRRRRTDVGITPRQS